MTLGVASAPGGHGSPSMLCSEGRAPRSRRVHRELFSALIPRGFAYLESANRGISKPPFNVLQCAANPHQRAIAANTRVFAACKLPVLTWLRAVEDNGKEILLMPDVRPRTCQLVRSHGGGVTRKRRVRPPIVTNWPRARDGPPQRISESPCRPDSCQWPPPAQPGYAHRPPSQGRLTMGTESGDPPGRRRCAQLTLR